MQDTTWLWNVFWMNDFTCPRDKPDQGRISRVLNTMTSRLYSITKYWSNKLGIPYNTVHSESKTLKTLNCHLSWKISYHWIIVSLWRWNLYQDPLRDTWIEVISWKGEFDNDLVLLLFITGTKVWSFANDMIQIFGSVSGIPIHRDWGCQTIGCSSQADEK